MLRDCRLDDIVASSFPRSNSAIGILFNQPRIPSNIRYKNCRQSPVPPFTPTRARVNVRYRAAPSRLERLGHAILFDNSPTLDR